MIENELTTAVAEAVTDAVKDLMLQTKNGMHRPPKVCQGYLTPKRSGEEDDFPFVLVRAESGASERGSTSVEVALIIGCFSEETDGYAYCLEVMQRIRSTLCTEENQTLQQKYQLQFPVQWANVTEQPYPQWQIEMTTRWVFNTPQHPSKEGGY